MNVWYDVHGGGPAVALLHAGVADSRMWAPQLRTFTATHTVLRLDFPGFGNSPYESELVSYRGAVREALDAAEIETAALVGVSLGGNAALEFAVESADRVSALVLVGSGLPDHEWSDTVRAFLAAEEEALERREVEAAVEANLRMWLAGPNRDLEGIDAELRNLVGEMQRQAFRLDKGHQNLRADRLDPTVSERLGDVRVPTLVVTGAEDVQDILTVADRIATEIPGARRASIPGAAHLPNLERPDEFDRLVLEFLHQTRG